MSERGEEAVELQRMVLGQTGIEVLRLGFGGIPIQRVSEEEAVATVAHAIQAGVEFIDTSRMYTTSEHRIGLALARAKREVVVATKSTARTADGILADVELSRAQLQREHIELYQCHFINDVKTYEQVIGAGGALEGLQRAKRDGRIGHIGLTSHSLDMLDRALDDGLFETIMVCFGILEPQAREKIIPKARAKNIGIIAMKSFSGGEVDRADLAIRYGLAELQVLLIPGVESPELFDDNWRIFEEDLPLSAKDLDEIATLQRKYEHSFCRRCDYCQPCPEGIYIQTVLGLSQLIKRTGAENLRKGHLAANIEKARHCTQCRECVERCPYQLPIPELIQEHLAFYDAQR
jgi:predicted aldo/keto reductase-like oxidoreductase